MQTATLFRGRALAVMIIETTNEMVYVESVAKTLVPGVGLQPVFAGWVNLDELTDVKEA